MQKIITTKSGQLTVERRAFLKKSGALAVMSMFGAAFFTSCADSDDMVPDANNPNMPPPGNTNGVSIANNVITIDLDVQSALKTAGAWLLIIQAQTLVVNVGNNNFNALTSVCTHSGCDRNWTFQNNVFTCSCHGSRFDTEGGLINGPANQPLQSFSTRVEEDILTVTK
ncbi:QcrA and Rieske domain-containing protein [Pararhodonellum marinum]|uniref:QcrA and Rieske domain-containing protein n=1 Tax=Pararhodonellum marinum TaxID=2755358 RepID=UPI00188E43AE|nr:Rieske (2Fe-2S) protein [Pararhodonellum marinum]